MKINRKFYKIQWIHYLKRNKTKFRKKNPENNMIQKLW